MFTGVQNVVMEANVKNNGSYLIAALIRKNPLSLGRGSRGDFPLRLFFLVCIADYH